MLHIHSRQTKKEKKKFLNFYEKYNSVAFKLLHDEITTIFGGKTFYNFFWKIFKVFSKKNIFHQKFILVAKKYFSIIRTMVFDNVKVKFFSEFQKKYFSKSSLARANTQLIAKILVFLKSAYKVLILVKWAQNFPKIISV